MKARIYRPLPSTNPPSDGATASKTHQHSGLRRFNLKKLSPVSILLLAVVLNLTAFSSAALAQLLRPGDSGAEVETLQYQLERLRYFNGPFTGYYGELTENAIRQFQRDNGLVVDGIYGPATERRLLSTIDIGYGPGDGFGTNFPPDRSSGYVVVVPDRGDAYYEVRSIVGEAFTRPDKRGEYVEAGRFSSYGSAENLVNRLRQAGLDARVVYFR